MSSPPLSNPRVPRAAYIEQSVQDFIRAGLLARGFPETQVEIRDDFEQREMEATKQLTMDFVAMGFNFDDGGAPIELGSNLRHYSHNIEVFVIARSADRGRALAYAAREDLEREGRVPLLDILDDTKPQIDVLLVGAVKVERQVTSDPAPWQEFAWLVTVLIEDDAYPTS